MNKKLYVGNLSYATTEDDLRQLFSEFGNIESVNIITDRMSGQSKGFGFVEMGTEAEAQLAADKLNNTELNERNITVSEARPQKERTFNSGGYGSGGGFGGRRSDRGSGSRRGGSSRSGSRRY